MVLMTVSALCALFSRSSFALPLASDTQPMIIVQPQQPMDATPPTEQTIAFSLVTNDPPPETPSLSEPETIALSIVPAVTSPPAVVTTQTFAFPVIQVSKIEETEFTTLTATATQTRIVTVFLPEPSPAKQPTTVTPPPSSSTQPPPSTTTSQVSSTTSKPTAWAAPRDMVDLSPFTVLGGNTRSLNVVTGIPSAASSTTAYTIADAAQPTAWANDSAVIRAFYPKGSINPGNKEHPYGGGQFYATPLDVEEARNLTMSYSTFFPQDFEWVQGGKLPGLYGGHTGCSGGNDAGTCWSTRLMWRKDGEGELYLYAPKDKQTKALCDDPRSTCDAAYGFSIGRGSFKYAKGGWTNLEQTVVLNSPGKQDGIFTLRVNGQEVIHRNDVYYRAHVNDQGEVDDAGQPPAEDDSDSKGDGFLGFLDGLLGRAVQQALAMTVPSPTPTLSSAEMDGDGVRQVGFIGIFFSTFFGGHKESWASPKDQYVWFNDFGLLIGD
ncbi:polysaccharide lyase family 14 protein [Cylindrobasidium torrendii FP15055 ss-10]|uniref:Polysaccharide lyase family 14 protein n=1 Tax=Cylindrobasidium torrendii FP15055 ss-10 TaxID=1314674 RepID=A0A0D7BE24_9AGAR|nr:polysaccharide lyase family 14 protein [Cylindrobasidium torrendii FP15055 ss-10]